ncbi:uncharacterized protein RBU57_017510 isoform 2-T2 [Macrochelys suwanniensis]
MKELVVLDEEGKEPWVRCRRPACDLLPEAKPPKRRPRVHKQAPKAAPRPWNSCHHLAAPLGHPPAGSAPGHHASAWLPRAVSLSHFPSSRLPVAAPRPLPLLTFANQPLGLALHREGALNSPAPAPSRLPRPARPASPRLDPPAAERAELEQNVARVLRGHPGGISLFRFRQAYGAAYSRPFPLDSTASVKEQLAAMPGAVRVEGWGVQTMLFRSAPRSSPARRQVSPHLCQRQSSLLPAPVWCRPPQLWSVRLLLSLPAPQRPAWLLKAQSTPLFSAASPRAQGGTGGPS